MSGRGEPRGGAGAVGGPHPTVGTRQRPAGPRAAVGDPGADRSHASPPGCPQVQYRPVATGPKLGWGVPRGAPSPTLGLQRGPSRPLAPCPCPTPITVRCAVVQDPKVVARPPPQFFF